MCACYFEIVFLLSTWKVVHLFFVLRHFLGAHLVYRIFWGSYQVVGAVNCARRGWVNIDVDTIACEACGARIFFSTPSSWNQHQGIYSCLLYFLL